EATVSGIKYTYGKRVRHGTKITPAELPGLQYFEKLLLLSGWLGQSHFQFRSYRGQHVIRIWRHEKCFFAQHMRISFFLSYLFDGIIHFTVDRSEQFVLFVLQSLVHDLLPVLDLVNV